MKLRYFRARAYGGSGARRPGQMASGPVGREHSASAPSPTDPPVLVMRHAKGGGRLRVQIEKSGVLLLRWLGLRRAEVVAVAMFGLSLVWACSSADVSKVPGVP